MSDKEVSEGLTKLERFSILDEIGDRAEINFVGK